MNPNDELEQLRQLAADALAGRDVDVEEMAERVQALDGWLSRGGYLPEAWGRPQLPTDAGVNPADGTAF